MEREPQSAYTRLKAAGVLQALQGRVAEAGMYRFCQLLEQALPDHPPLGSTAHPADDPVRFRPDPGMGFPAGELKAIETDAGHATPGLRAGLEQAKRGEYAAVHTPEQIRARRKAGRRPYR